MSNKGPVFDKFLMRTKDIVWLLGLLWAIIKGIDAYKDRFKNLEALALATNIGMGNMNKRLNDFDERFDRLEYPERYARRHKRGRDEGE